jgi:H+-transporting ATPase
LLFIVDFVALTLSTDNVSGSRKPGNWKIKPLVNLGFVLGGLNCIEAFAWFFLGKKFFGINGINELNSFGFAILFFTGIFNILIIRTPFRFYRQPIGKTLLSAIIIDVLFVIIILFLGLPGFTDIPAIVIAATLLYFLVCGLLVNDWIKVKFNTH